MADENTTPEGAAESKAEEKARKKAEKKEAKKKKKEGQAEEEQESSLLGKIGIFFATILIIAIWLGIFALLVRLDVGGFGSTVLYPILKDVPYVNKILPEVKVAEEDLENAEYPYKTVDEAIERIKVLEKQLAKAKANGTNAQDQIEDLQSQVRKLRKYKENEAAFEARKQEFYEEVVFADQAPDISEYRKFYEEIEPENAEVLYKEVIEQQQYDDKISDYVKTYSTMKAKSAAAIFDTMTDDFKLVSKILQNMSADARADILAAMDEDNAAKLTEMMEPSKN